MASEDNVTDVSGPKGVEESIQFAKKYLEDMLSFFGLNTDVYATTEDNQVIELHVPSTQFNAFLIGQHGDTMRSMQYTVSAALKNNEFLVTRVNVDVADYKKARAERLIETAEGWMKQVVSSGEPMELRPMNGADRRIVHNLASESGVLTESIGEGRERRVVLKPGEAESPESGDSDTSETSLDSTTEAHTDEPSEDVSTDKDDAKEA